MTLSRPQARRLEGTLPRRGVGQDSSRRLRTCSLPRLQPTSASNSLLRRTAPGPTIPYYRTPAYVRRPREAAPAARTISFVNGLPALLPYRDHCFRSVHPLSHRHQAGQRPPRTRLGPQRAACRLGRTGRLRRLAGLLSHTGAVLHLVHRRLLRRARPRRLVRGRVAAGHAGRDPAGPRRQRLPPAARGHRDHGHRARDSKRPPLGFESPA